MSAEFEMPALVGNDKLVATINNGTLRYLNLDNAATTPAFKEVAHKINRYLEDYGSVHRGSGFKSQISTAVFEEAIPIIMDYLGVSLDSYALIITANTTSAINKLTRILRFSEQDTIFLSEFEHSANDLPWRKEAQIVRIPSDDMGQFDMETFEEALKKSDSRGKKFVTVTAASSITGAITPIHEIAKIAHKHGAYIMVDAAQLVAHREIKLQGNREGEEIDFISFSGHKMYAPYGGGVLIGRRELLEKLSPEDIGGGNVDFVTNDSYDLSLDFFKRMTAGTPNVFGLISIAVACMIIRNKIGFEAIYDHEQAILSQAKLKFSLLESVQTYCDLNYDAKRKCSIITFNIDGINSNLVAARLGHEFGIGVRQGAICQFSYVANLLGLDSDSVQKARKNTLSGQKHLMYGIVRASFGIGNKPQDVDRLFNALSEIATSPMQTKRYYINDNGEFWPHGKPAIDASTFYNC